MTPQCDGPRARYLVSWISSSIWHASTVRQVHHSRPLGGASPLDTVMPRPAGSVLGEQERRRDMSASNPNNPAPIPAASGDHAGLGFLERPRL